jgi:PAS domain S-box-containing protein
VRILNLEDNERDSELIRLRLESAGVACELLRVETEAAYVRALENTEFDVIVADLNLPSFDGMRGLELARQRRPEIPFIFFSGMLGEEAAVEGLHKGAADYVLKQRPVRLAAAVRSALEQAKARRESARIDAELHVLHSELAAIHANAPVAMVVVDEELCVESANEMAARLAGRSASELRGLRCGDVFHCANTEAHAPGCGNSDPCPDCPMRRAVEATLRDGDTRENVELLVRMPVGREPKHRWLLVSSSKVDYGPRKRALLCAQDITELKQAHLDLQRQRDALALQAHLINKSHDAVIIMDAERRIVGWNKGAEEIYGWSSAQALGTVSRSLLKTTSPGSLVEMEELLSKNGQWEGELRHIRSDGQPLISDSRQTLLQDATGKTIGILEINRDITERRRDDETLKETARLQESALAEKTILLKEIHHRVKNNLAVIASLLSMKAGTTESEDARSALLESQERVHSMALIHEHLYGSGHLDRINFSDYAQTLSQELYQAFVREPGQVAIKLALDPIELGIERAVPCALMLNELISNAFKYAFPGNRRGEILISFRECPAGTLELAIEDDGIGMPAGLLGNPNNKSLGLQIVSILTKQLEGSVEQQPSAGTRIVIRFPAGSTAQNRRIESHKHTA